MGTFWRFESIHCMTSLIILFCWKTFTDKELLKNHYFLSGIARKDSNIWIQRIKLFISSKTTLRITICIINILRMTLIAIIFMIRRKKIISGEWTGGMKIIFARMDG